jgi:hypothetical protein
MPAKPISTDAGLLRYFVLVISAGKLDRGPVETVLISLVLSVFLTEASRGELVRTHLLFLGRYPHVHCGENIAGWFWFHFASLRRFRA